MTKEEVRQSLFNTKVYVAGKSAEIQKKLFELEFEWCGFRQKSVRLQEKPFLIINEKGIQWMDNMVDFVNDTAREVTADYILGLTWDEEKPKFQSFDKVLVRGNDNQVWCPNFYYDACDRRGKEYLLQILPYEGNEHLAYTTNNPE